MKTKILSAVLLGSSLCFTSCNDFLDLSPTAAVSDKLVWSKVEYAELAINNYYHYINTYGAFSNGQSTAGLTEAYTDIFKYSSMTYNSLMYIPNEFAYGGSVLTASYVDTYLGMWTNGYTYVRRINEGLANLKKYSDFSEEDMNRLEAEMRFFRGLIYFELMKRYKEVIIYDEDMESVQKDTPLSTEKEGWDFIEEDMTFAGKNLPVSTSANGRVTSGAAYALLSRYMLYAERWEVARKAAAEVLAMGYTLETNYEDAFLSNNSEAILQYSYDRAGQAHSFDNYYSPAGDPGNGTIGGYGTPTQEMVESFELATGGFPDWTPWHDEEGTTDTPPYEQLEPRFHATVLYNGATWKGRTIEPFIGGADGWCTWKEDAVPAGRTTTGYYLRKLVDETHDFTEAASGIQPWIHIRLAEVMLNYAEACYQLGEISQANDALRSIRARVDLPYTDKSGTELMAAIRQERKVELAYEGLYYWDMRRWGLAESAFTGNRVHGLKIVQNANGSFTYSYVDCDLEDRHFPAKMYRLPLPTTELNNNSSVEQYPEWR